MKMLIVGIDGGDLEIMKHFDMPFVHKFLEENTNIELEEDLFNRGWAEILTGKEGADTRAFYMSPILDGSHRFSTKFSMQELEKDHDVVPLWELLEMQGINYCMMNIPTTSPVYKTDKGVIVGGGGGGINSTDGIPDTMVSSKEVKDYLESKNYLTDIRRGSTDFEKTADFFSSLNMMQANQTECFIDLCKKNKTDFGFFTTRSSTEIQYLARSEIDSHMAINQMAELMPGSNEKSIIHADLEQHYLELDQHLEKLYCELNPEHFVITSDHNVVSCKFYGNTNAFLLHEGYLVKKTTAGFIKHTKHIVKNLLIITHLAK